METAIRFEERKKTCRNLDKLLISCKKRVAGRPFGKGAAFHRPLEFFAAPFFEILAISKV
jgi:hypothetical protein